MILNRSLLLAKHDKQLVKTVETLLKNYSMFYSEIQNHVLQSPHESISLEYQSDRTFTFSFQAFCRSLLNLEVLRVMNYLARMEI